MIYKDKEKLQVKFINGFIKNEFYDVIFNYWTLLKNKQINNQKKIEKRTSSKQLADNFVKKLLNNIISLKHEIANYINTTVKIINYTLYEKYQAVR
ncbi:MAG: hypothetical protein SPLM_03540 [Spiroplasma phoeniceum]|uniref:hypothetical protein n=1 Tax=Spiroplasma phoeniceum TaxID=47835 RepID=UPI00326A9399